MLPNIHNKVLRNSPSQGAPALVSQYSRKSSFDPQRFSQQAARNIQRAHNAMIRYHSLIHGTTTQSVRAAAAVTTLASKRGANTTAVNAEADSKD
jgi:hypothetical protein